MFHPRMLLNFFFPVFKPLERILLSELMKHLEGPSADILARRLRNINVVQRHQSREICMYQIKAGKTHHDPEAEFPAKSDDLLFARIDFTIDQGIDKWRAEFHIVRGNLFSIVFTPSAKGIFNKTGVSVISIKILHDPMKPIHHPKLKSIQQPFFVSGWLKAWSQRFVFINISGPIEKSEIVHLLKAIEAKLPSDYLEMLNQCNGFQMDKISILGISEIYEILLNNQNYYVLSVYEDLGVIATRRFSDDQQVYFLEYGLSEPLTLGNSLHEGIEILLKKTKQ